MWLTEPLHLRPTAELAPRILLPGDPGRALLLAQELLERPRMFNHHRGLWGYSGQAPDGEPLTIQSTGMGGPSAAIVIQELADLGARDLVRVGTCGSLSAPPSLGELLVVPQALTADGASLALLVQPDLAAEASSPTWTAADPALLEALRTVPGPSRSEGKVVSSDLFYEVRDERQSAWAAAGAVAVDMETATLFALAARRELRAACLLLVTDVITPERTRIDQTGLREGEIRMGRLALDALSRVGGD